MNTFDPKDDRLIRKEFERLVNEHAGEYVAVASGNMVFGRTRADVEKKISKKIKNPPSVMQIPHKESLTCAL